MHEDNLITRPILCSTPRFVVSHHLMLPSFYIILFQSSLRSSVILFQQFFCFTSYHRHQQLHIDAETMEQIFRKHVHESIPRTLAFAFSLCIWNKRCLKYSFYGLFIHLYCKINCNFNSYWIQYIMQYVELVLKFIFSMTSMLIVI